MSNKPASPLTAASIEPVSRGSSYPEPFARLMALREKRRLGDAFDLSNFGINLTTLQPGGSSALMHAHTQQDEFLYVLEGTAVALHGGEEYEMSPGDCIGFKANSGHAHQLVNRSDAPVRYLEIGDRSTGDAVTYPNDDLQATLGSDGNWLFYKKNGMPY